MSTHPGFDGQEDVYSKEIDLLILPGAVHMNHKKVETLKTEKEIESCISEIKKNSLLDQRISEILFFNR